MMRTVLKYETEVDNTKTIVNKGKKYLSEQKNVNISHINQSLIATKRAKAVKTKCKINMIHENEETWTQKAMHGQYGREMRKENVNFVTTCRWLYQGLIKAETESLIIAAQDQAITTNYIKKTIHKQDVDPKCRLCKQFNETIHHIVSGCPVLAQKEYIERHNNVCKQLHFNICKHFGIETPTDKWYEYEPSQVVTKEDIVILWYSQVHTDRTIRSNKPDIIIKDKTNRTCQLIDVSIPLDSNITAKEAEKKLKYKDLQIETQRMWGLKTIIIPVNIGATGTINMNVDKKENEKKLKYTDLAIEIQRMWNMKSCKIVPVVIGALGAISKSAKSNLELIPGYFNLHEIQTCTVLGTAHIMRKFGI
ncbi:hypothetical protein WDU94_003708 [Cyamophila willieti]